MKIGSKFLNRVLPSCKEVSHLISHALDEPLTLRKHLGLKIHLRICIWCRRNDEQLQFMRKLACNQTLSNNEQAKLSSDAFDRILKSLKQND